MRGIVIPLGILFLAGLFTPLNPLQSNSKINPSLGGLQSNATLICTSNGCTTYQTLALTPQALCDANYKGADLATIKAIQTIPFLSNVFNWFLGLGQQVNNAITGNPNSLQTSQNCYNASNALLAINYNTKAPDTISYFFIGALFTILGIVILSGITIAGSGLNTGAIFVIMTGGALLVIWVILSATAVPTFRQLPTPVGPYLYFSLTLWYALSTIGSIGGIRD